MLLWGWERGGSLWSEGAGGWTEAASQIRLQLLCKVLQWRPAGRRQRHRPCLLCRRCVMPFLPWQLPGSCLRNVTPT